MPANQAHFAWVSGTNPEPSRLAGQRAQLALGDSTRSEMVARSGEGSARARPEAVRTSPAMIGQAGGHRMGEAWLELRAPPAVPAAVTGRDGGDGERRERAAGAGRRGRGSRVRRGGPARRSRWGSGSTPATGYRWHAQPRRCSLGGRGPARACAASGGGMAAAALAAVAGPGDIDSLAIAPTGVGFVIETKTRAYDDRHLARVREQAAWLSRRRRRWCRRGAVPVVCLVRARGVQRLEQDVLVVSIDRLIPMLRSAVRWFGRPGDELGTR